MKRNITYIIIGLLLAFLGIIFYGGYRYGYSKKECPKIDTTYVYKYDTVWHYITKYIIGKDSIIYDTTYLDKPIDTAYILRDYYAKHTYTRTFPSDTVSIIVMDTVTQNKFLGSVVKYKVNVPFTTINTTVDNSTTYDRYLYFGIDVPIKNLNYIELEGIYGTEKYYLGAGYTPQLKSFDVKLGTRIIKFKKKK